MSAQYIERMRQIRGEYQAARQALRYVNENWDRQGIYTEVEGITPVDLIRAADRMEATYILRLFAEFESILENHLNANHPSINVPKLSPSIRYCAGILAKCVTIGMPLLTPVQPQSSLLLYATCCPG